MRMHWVLMIVACGFGCSIAGSRRTSLLAAVIAALGFWLVAAAVGYQPPGVTLPAADRAFYAYAGPVAAIALPFLAGAWALRERRRSARLQVSTLLLCGGSFINGALLGLSLWGFAPYEDGGLFAGLIGIALAGLGTGAAALLLLLMPPQEMRSNVVALLFGSLSIVLGTVAVSDPKTLKAVSDHSYRGW